MISPMSRFWIIAGVVLSLFAARTAFAVDQNSVNFKNNDSTFAPAAMTISSSNFKVSGSIEPLVGSSQSAGFGIQSGVPVPEGTAAAAATPSPSPAPSGGGGSGSILSIGYVVPPTFTYKTPTFKSHQIIKGTRGSRDTTILVNGSSDGVAYPSDSTWERDLPLNLGANAVIVQGRIPSGYATPSIGGTILRLLIGDVNTDGVVNDRDLSLFVRAWKKYTPYADFDENGVIDDIDLSLLASHWGQRI